MKQVLATILLLFCTVGMIFSPNGIFSCLNYVPEAYSRCVAEDPEITDSDFLFEHLLCLESVAEFMEHGDDEDPDPAVPPYNLPQQIMQTVVVAQPTISIQFHDPILPLISKSYSLYRNPFITTAYTGRIFRPPCTV